MFGPRRGPNISRAKHSRPKHLKCSHGYAFFACTPNVCTGKLFRQMFVRVGLCFYFFSPLHYAKGLDREATSLPGQTFEMFGPRVWTTCCKNVCTGRPFAVFGNFSKGVQGRKKPRDPNLQLGLTREAFSPKRLTRTNIQNPMFVPRGFFGPQSGAAQTSGGGKQRAAPPRRATEMARKWWFRRLDVWAAPDGLTRKG